MGMNTRYVKEYFYKKKIRSMFVWNLEIIAVILLAAAFSWFFCRSVVVQEGSMEPTLVPGERVLMDSAWYRLSSPKRGDIIAFRTSEDKKASIHIKRVIALPGETVQIKDGQILINGDPSPRKSGPTNDKSRHPEPANHPGRPQATVRMDFKRKDFHFTLFTGYRYIRSHRRPVLSFTVPQKPS